jgi:predicted MFS family arabinose efflux permease
VARELRVRRGVNMEEERTVKQKDGLLQNRRFVALATAHVLTRLAFWMAFLGMMSLASFTLRSEASGTAFVLGALGAPFIVLAPFSGMLVDRSRARTTLASTYVIGAALSLGLVHVTTLWQLVVGAALWGVSGTLIFPSLGAMLKRGLVREDQLPRANSVIQAGWEVTLIAGPALSGFLAKQFSTATPFYVSAVLYLAGVAVLALVPAFPPKTERTSSPGELLQGVAVLFRRPDLRAIAVWGGFATAAFSAILAIEPVFVRDVLGGGADRLGLIYSFGGMGATAGALLAGSGRFGRRELAGIVGAFGLYGVAAIAYAWIADWPAVIPAVMALQMGFSGCITLTVILVQRRSPAEVVGRALAAQRGVEQCFDITGTLLGGAIAAALGTRSTILWAGVVVIVAALVLAARGTRIQSDEGEPHPTGELQHPPLALERFD